MEYNEKKKREVALTKKASLNMIVGIIIVCVMTIITFVIFDNSLSIFDSLNKDKEIQLNKLHFEELKVNKPDKYKEEIQYLKLPNDVEIILFNSTNNKKLKKNAIGVIVGSGAMNDDKIEGLAHLTEHMLFLGSKKYPNVTFFNDFITTNEGHFNGFTDKDTTTFIYEINKEKFLESLDVFLNFFVKPLFKPDHVEKEIFAVNSEFEKNIHSEEKRFDRLFQLCSNPLHPFNKFSTGNKETLKDIDNPHNLRESVTKYFHKHYIGRNIKVVVYGNYELNEVKKILKNNLNKINNNYHVSSKDIFLDKLKEKYGKSDKDLEIFTEKEKGKIIFFKSRFKTLKIFYIVKDFKNNLSENPKNFFKRLFSIRHKNSLIELLIHHRLIFNMQIEFKDKYNNLSAIGFKFLLTEHGLRNADLIIRLLSRYIQIFHKNINNEENFNSIRNMVNSNFKKQKSINNPYKSLKKMTKNFYLFGKKNFITADNLLNKFNPEILHDFIKNMTLQNSVIFIGSRSFKHFNESYLYKVLNKLNHTQDSNNTEYNHTNTESISKFNNINLNKTSYTFSENTFINKREKWYKTKYAEFQIDHDDIWHIFRRKLKDSQLSFPNFNTTSAQVKLEDNSLCKDENNKKIKLKECKKIYRTDRKFLTPSLIYKSDGSKSDLNYTINSEIYYKLDRTHLKKSFNIKIKIEPNFEFFNITEAKIVPYTKFLMIYLNFLWSELKVDSKYYDNIHNKFISVQFKDNFKKPTKLFVWRNSKEKLSPEDYMIDGVYLDIHASSELIYEKSDINKILKDILEKKFDNRDFLYLKEELYRYIEFYKSSNPSHQALNWFYRLGFKHDIDYFNMTSLIKDITIDEINNFKENIFSQIKIKSLAVGTIEENKASLYIQNIEKIFVNFVNKSLDQQLNKSFNTTFQKFIQAPYTKYGSHFIFQKNNIYKHSPDSTTLHVYFLGANSIYNYVNINMIKQIAGNIFFSYLRIKHQLGYSVKNSLVNINNNLMFFVHVQGSKKHPSHVQQYIDKVIPILKTKLDVLDEKSFILIKEKMFDKINKIDNGLTKISEYYWDSIIGQENIFDRKRLKEFLDRLTISDLMHFIDNIVEKRLSIQVANANTKYEKIDKESFYISDLNYFREFANYGTPEINENESEKLKVNSSSIPVVSLRIDLSHPFRNNNQIAKK